nr:MAG TPA: minor tail protein [Caudoviricetes sp.]
MTLTEDVSSKMQNIANSARTTASQITSTGRAIDNAFRSGALDSFASSAESAAGVATSSFEDLGSTIDDIFSDADSAIDSFSDGMRQGFHEGIAESLDEISDGTEEVEDAIEDLGRAMEDLGDTDFESDGLEDLGEDAEDAGEGMEDAGSAAESLGGMLKKLFAIAGGAAVLKKIGDYARESVDAFMGLETGMAEVSTLLSDDADMVGMTDQVKEFSLETGKLTSEIVPALYQSISASVPQETVFDFLEVANMAAVGGVTELETAVDGITSVMNAYGQENLSAAQASDQMFTAVKLGKTTFGELASSLFNVVPTAVSAGVAFGDVTAAIATMTASGTPTSVATTQMRQALVELSDGGSQVGETFQKLAGTSFRDFIASGGNVGEALNLLYDHAQETGVTIQELFSSVEAGNAAAQLTGGHAKTFADDIAAMGASSGATEAAYSKMTDTFEHKTELLSAGFENIKLEAGEALAEALSPAADSLLENMDDIKEPVVDFFSAIGDIISNVAPLIPGVLNTLSSGLSAIGKVIGPVFKAMGEHPEAVGAGLTSIATGLVAMKAVSAGGKVAASLKGVESIGGALAKLAPTIFSNPWAAGAAAVVAAVTAIGLAIHAYNEQQIKSSLADHFGDIELTAAQIEAAAGHILNAKYLVNIQGALNEFENADALAEEAEAALAANDALEWKASIGMTWEESEVEEYISNIDTFISSSMAELESRTYAATVTVKTMLGGTEEGASLAEQMEAWAVQDELEMQALSEQLSSAVEKAMIDGVLDANEQAAITILQSKMNTILSSWKETDSQAAMDLIDQKYGSMSGKDLTSDTFVKMIEELGKQREEAIEAVDEASTELYGTINGLMNSGRLTAAEGEKYKNMVAEAARNMEASALTNSVNFETNTLSDTYGELLKTNYAQMEQDTKSFIDQASNLFSQGDIMGAFDQLQMGESFASIYSGLFSSSDQKALKSIYENMKPDVSEMSALIDEYRSVGQAIPQELMTSFNEAMQLGAAAGDTNAAWQVFANQMVADPANDALVQAIQDGTQAAPQELRDALDIALAETTSEPIEMDGLMVALSGMDLDVSQIAELTGMTEAEVQAYLDQYGIEVNEEVDVKTQAGDVDETGAVAAGQAAEAAAQSAAGEDAEVDKTVTANTTYVAGVTDTSQVENAATAELASGTAEQEIVTNTTYVPGTTDTSQVTGATEAALAEQTINGTATANVTAQMGTDNFAETTSAFASRFQSALASAFNKTFTATTNASITVNYSIANPSKTITFSGGGSGTATVYAHATGGYFTDPHYGLVAEAGPEFIIPDDGSANAIGLWQQAGESLGMLDAPISTPPSMPAQGANGGDTKSSRDINLNINGSGSFKVGGGVSKEDVVEILLDNVREALIGIIEQDILVEGEGAYEY